MKFTLSWLQEYVSLDGISPAQLADDLTMLGLEVDAMVPLYRELAELKTALVTETSPHPDADKLSVCTVLCGEQRLQIVCGAPNVRPEFCGVVALPGTTLPGNFKIKKSKVRGVESQGMLCSERELGLSEEHDGIMELPPETPHGLCFIEAAGLEDTMVEVDLTPNRPDCASVIGIAREIAGKYRRPLQLPCTDMVLEAQSPSFSVTVENPDLCPRYAGRLIRGVRIAPSPWWLRKRLLSVGMRPINNIVDITNLVMLEYGQPLHAFDFKTLADQRIVVRTPRPEELRFTTLDGAERPLDPETLMICDGRGPVAVAGVMGGLDSEVTGETAEVLLESACFNPVSIRKTARRLNLPSEASYRFERGVDPDGTLNAMERAVRLMEEIAGGTAEDGGADVYEGRIIPAPLQLRISKTSELLGAELSRDRVRELLESIEIRCSDRDEDSLTVEVPSFRVDLEREVDLVEEIARLIGYNDIPISLPGVNLSYPDQDQERVKRKQAASLLCSLGFHEAINYSFYSSDYPRLLQLDAADERCSQVRILNPLSEEQDEMRTTLLPGLLENVRRNLNFQQSSGRLFEIGKVFFPVAGEELARETTRLAGVLFGRRYGSGLPYHFEEVDHDLYDVKGTLEALLETMRLGGDQGVTVIPAEQPEPFTAAGQALALIHQGTVLGTAGKLKGEVLRSFGIKRQIFYFDLDFAALAALAPQPKTFKQLPVYPSVKRDLALVVTEATPAGQLIEAVMESREKLVEHCTVFDIFRGEKIPDGCKSVALSITYRSPSKTLTEKQVEKAHAKLVKLITDRFGASFRET